MKTDLLLPFENIPYFSLEAFKQSADIESPHTARMLLHRWAKSGRILMLKRGIYMSRQFYERHQGDEAFSMAVSAVLLPQSYVSLEFVLQQNNLLTEITYPITCITAKNTRTIENAIGAFWYRNIRKDLYAGYSISEYHGIRYAKASVAKALFDYLYLRPIPAAYRSSKIDLAEELRLNLDELDSSSLDEFARYTENSGSQKMQAILDNFRENK
ncbi:MAG: type IV toxin-antitoxin system AbiEi family antitoxin domain-containing protein [Chloroflexota bacterium]